MTDEPHLDREAIENLKVIMENDFNDLIDTFLADSEQRMISVREAVEAADADAIRKAAHSFKGASVNIGAIALSRLCKELEDAGARGDVAHVVEWVAKIDQERQLVAELLMRERH